MLLVGLNRRAEEKYCRETSISTAIGDLTVANRDPSFLPSVAYKTERRQEEGEKGTHVNTRGQEHSAARLQPARKGEEWGKSEPLYPITGVFRG